MSRNKKFVKKYFDNEYVLYDEPHWHYKIHLNKLSYGWRPLFQRHKHFQTFAELELFYNDYKNDLVIINEYDEKMSWEMYKGIILNHANVTPKPLKWVYDIDPIDKLFSDNPRKTLHTTSCKPEEADLWTPLKHSEYAKTEAEARRKFKCYDYIVDDDRSWEDPDYPIDWIDGDFC